MEMGVECARKRCGVAGLMRIVLLNRALPRVSIDAVIHHMPDNNNRFKLR